MGLIQQAKKYLGLTEATDSPGTPTSRQLVALTAVSTAVFLPIVTLLKVAFDVAVSGELFRRAILKAVVFGLITTVLYVIITVIQLRRRQRSS